MGTYGIKAQRRGRSMVLTLDLVPSNALLPVVRAAILAKLMLLSDSEVVVLIGMGPSFSSALELEPDKTRPSLAELCQAIAEAPGSGRGGAAWSGHKAGGRAGAGGVGTGRQPRHTDRFSRNRAWALPGRGRGAAAACANWGGGGTSVPSERSCRCRRYGPCPRSGGPDRRCALAGCGAGFCQDAWPGADTARRDPGAASCGGGGGAAGRPSGAGGGAGGDRLRQGGLPLSSRRRPRP